MELRLDGRVAIVTGASRGIGHAIASAFATAGASVVLVSRKEETLRQAAGLIDGDVAVHPANVGDLAAAEACVAETMQRFGSVDILVNNAAANPYYGPMLEISPSQFDKIIEVNLRGPLFWSKAAWQQSMRERPGVILNISSGGSVYPTTGLGVYDMAKAALNLFTRQLAGEIAPTRVVCIAPGLVETHFSQILVEGFGEEIARRLPARRLGQPEDVADLALFLVSDHATYITGETYFVDGGTGSQAAAP
jgi:NAD(P)-dependent dehydrogenase (short-subunit alcohol dehydrogenase family)